MKKYESPSMKIERLRGITQANKWQMGSGNCVMKMIRQAIRGHIKELSKDGGNWVVG